MIVIINRGAGHGHAGTQARILDLFQDHGAAVELLVARNGSEMVALAKEAAQSNDQVKCGRRRRRWND